MKNLFLMFIMIFVGNIFVSTVCAEIRTYEGIGKFEITGESLEYAKNQAKLQAERDISEQIYIQVKSDSKVKNGLLEYDEIIVITESLMKIIEINYKLLPNEKNPIICATVKAEIDTEEVEKIISERKSE